jgi:hypothetical protein
MAEASAGEFHAQSPEMKGFPGIDQRFRVQALSFALSQGLEIGCRLAAGHV